MRNWGLIKKQYISGKTPRELSEMHGITAQQISNRVSKEKWIVEKSKKDEDLASKYTSHIEACLELGFNEMQAILKDNNAKDSDKVSAFKAILDVSGLKKETLKNELSTDKNIQLIINRTPIKPNEVNNQ